MSIILRFDGNDMKIPSEDIHSFRGYQHGKPEAQKDIDQSKEHTRGNQLNLLRGQNNKMMGGQVDQVKDDWN